MTFVNHGMLKSRLYLGGSRLLESSGELSQASSLDQLHVGSDALLLLSQARLVWSSVSRYGFPYSLSSFGIVIGDTCGSETSRLSQLLR